MTHYPTKAAPVIISGKSSKELATDVAQGIHARSVNVDFKQFTDEEIRVIIEQNVGGQDVIVMGSASGDPNTVEKENRLLLRAAKKGRATSVMLVLPYITYGRSDSTFDRRSSPGLIDTITTYRPLCDHVIIADPHNPLITQEIFEDLEHNKSSTVAEFGYLYGQVLSDLFNQGIITRQNLEPLYPDAGASKRISETFRRALYSAADIGLNSVVGLDPNASDEWSQVTANRDRNTGDKRFSILGDVKDKDIVIFEDMIASGGTACDVARILKDKGARSVILFATSGLFTPKNKITSDQTIDKIEWLLQQEQTTGDIEKITELIQGQRESEISVINRINNSALDAVFITDTYDHTPVAPRVAQAIHDSPIIHTVKTAPMLGAMIEAVRTTLTSDMPIDETSIFAIKTGQHHRQQDGNSLYRPIELKPNSPLLALKAA